jgi:signal transduction histidine kinase
VEQRLRVQYNELAELAGSLAHEIKNPLSVISMNMELLAEDFAHADTPQQRRALVKIQTVQKQCTRLENLLQDFLKFARLRDLKLLPGSLNEIVDRVLDMFEHQARENGIEFIRYLDPALPSIKLDEQTLHAALVNLVKNSIEAMPDGGAVAGSYPFDPQRGRLGSDRYRVRHGYADGDQDVRGFLFHEERWFWLWAYPPPGRSSKPTAA